MNARLAAVLLISAALAGALRAAEEAPAPEAPAPSMKERLKARIAEDAKKVPPGRPAPSASTAASSPVSAKSSGAGSPTDPAKAETPAPPAAPVAAASTPPSGPARETPTVLPKVEVKKERITVLDQKIAEQELAIARERKNVKASEVDLALNDSKIAKPMSIFGGESSQFRQRVASERVQLMEAERDILEAMKRARTKEEKAELQKQLDELRAVRRDLEKSLR